MPFDPNTDQVLAPDVSASLATLRTAQALQRHQEWVSQPAAEIPKLVAQAGFVLVVPVIEPELSGGQAYVARRPGETVVSFRGSGGDDLDETLLNSLHDADALAVRPRELLDSLEQIGLEVHRGFYRNYLDFRETVRDAVAKNPEDHVYVTGFSLGSSLATLCAMDLAHNDQRAVTLHGMGTPRVGNRKFVDFMAGTVPNMLRTVFTLDPVPRLPPHISELLGYCHAGKLAELEEDGTPVPLLEIDGRMLTRESVKDHNRDKYAAMIAGLIAQFGANSDTLLNAWGDPPLQNAADAEAKSVKIL